MPKYQVNKEAIEAYLKENPLNLLTIANNKPIHLNLKIAKRDLNALEVISELCGNENEQLKKKSEWINWLMESLIIDAFESLTNRSLYDGNRAVGEYIQLRIAETVDLILKNKHNYYGKEKFSWVRQFIGNDLDVESIKHYYDDSVRKEQYRINDLLKRYIEKVKDESNK